MADQAMKIDVNGQRVPLTPEEMAQQNADANAPTEFQKHFISKVEMWKRCTEDEAEGLYSDLRQAPVRLQALFDGAQIIDTRDDFFSVLQAIVVSRVGNDRAAVILAPTS